VAKFNERRQILIQQRADIDLTLQEIDRLEEQCRGLLDKDDVS
jgi:hypothetical protein